MPGEFRAQSQPGQPASGERVVDVRSWRAIVLMPTGYSRLPSGGG